MFNIIHGGGFTVRKMKRELGDWWVIAVKLNDLTLEIISNPMATLDLAYGVHGRTGHCIVKFPFGYNVDPYIQFEWINDSWQVVTAESAFQLLPVTNLHYDKAGVALVIVRYTGVNIHPNGYHVQVYDETAGINYDFYGDSQDHINCDLSGFGPIVGHYIRFFVETLGTFDGFWVTSVPVNMPHFIY